MNICLLARNFLRNRGGISTFTLMLANELATRGHRVHVIAEAHDNKFHAGELREGVHLHAVAIKGNLFPGAWRLEATLPIRTLAYARAVAVKVRELHRQENIDVLEAPASSLETLFLSRLQGLHTVLRFHGGDKIVVWHTGRMHHTFKEWVSRLLERIEIRRATGLIAVSNSVAEFAREYWRLGRRSVDVIHNGIDPEEVKSSHYPKRLQIMFAGLLHENKGIYVLAETIKLLEQRGVTGRYVIVGADRYAGTEQSPVEEFYSKNGYRSDIHFAGLQPRSEVYRNFQESAVVVVPSLYEPFGLVAIEAMACGCVVVASKSGGLAEIIVHEESGLLVPPGNPVALADALQRVLADDELRARLSMNAPARVRQHFTISKVARRSLEIYTRVLR